MMRRGSTLELDARQDKVFDQFKIGDLVTPYYAPGGDFYGIVVDKNAKECKLYVDFNGTIHQMDPYEARITQKSLLAEPERPLQMARSRMSAERRAQVMMAGREAVYYDMPPRLYRRTRHEIDNNLVICPKCGEVMEREPYTKSERMWRCPGCVFKVSNSAITR